MALDRFEVRISIHKLLLGLIVVIVPLSIFGFYLTERSDRALDRNIGTDFRTIAELYSDQVSQFIRARVTQVNSMAADPAIIEAVSAANKAYSGLDDAAVNAKINTTKKDWNTTQGEAAVKKVLYSSASDLLRRRRDLDADLLRVMATDEHGVAVAATQKPRKYSYAEDVAWRATYANGQGTASVGDILFDELRKNYYVDFGTPIFDAGSSRFIGVLIASINVSDLLSKFQQPQLSNGARALLIGEDGTIVSGPKIDVFARLKSDEFDAVRESLGSLQGRQTGYVTTDVGTTGKRIIAFAETGLKQHYDNLGWIVLVSQEKRLATAPLRTIEQFALLMVILGILMVTLLGVYYYLHRSQKFSDIVLPGHVSSAPVR
jgi:hypothetical protein